MSLKILVVSDIHGSFRSINRINASIYNHEPDAVVICGDITDFGYKEDAVDILEKIDIDNILGVTGNCDPKGVEKAFEIVGGVYLDLNSYEFMDHTFSGLSGSKYSKSRLSKFREIAAADIFVFHSPPYGYLDEASRGKHIGERGLLEIIAETGPMLVLSGHVHESRGVIEEDGTVYVNPGPAYEDNLAIVEIADDVRVKLI